MSLQDYEVRQMKVKYLYIYFKRTVLKDALNNYILALLLISVSSGHPFHTFSIYKKKRNDGFACLSANCCSLTVKDAY